MAPVDEDEFVSEPESDAEPSEFPDAEDDVADFGWADERKVSGRRKKAQQAARKKAKAGSFDTMGLSELVLKGIRRKGFRLPTPIQRKAIPLILQGLDVVGMARTGSGKTAAFVIPLLERVKAHAMGKNGPRGVLLAPTRELALQTHRVLKDLGRYTDLRTAILVGGDSMEAQFAELAASPDVLVATPGRLVHHLAEIDGFSLKSVEYVVFDEADRLFEMGFADQLRQILGAMSPSRQTLLFSATMPRLLAEFARAGLKNPEFVRLDADSKLSPDLSTAFFTVRYDDKPAALLFLLREVVPQGQSNIVFTATRHHVEFLAALLRREGISVAAVHGNMDQAARKIAIAKFRAGKASVLVVTDVAARGLDIPLLDNVVNYDFPSKPKLFVHRAGRAARAGRSGTAYSLATRDELGFLVDLHLFLSKPLVPAPIRGLREAAAAAGVHAHSNGHTADQANGNGNGNVGREEDASSSVFGAFPQAAIDDAIEHIRSVLDASPDLSSQLKSLENATKLYLKTRPAAAPESVRRAKEMAKEGVHPLLAAALPSDALGGLEAQECLADITAKLRAYRPSATVFEAEVAPARAGQGAGLAAMPGVLAAAPHERKLEVMKRKRAAHAETIAAQKRREGADNERSSMVAHHDAANAVGDGEIDGNGDGDDDNNTDDDGLREDGDAALHPEDRRARHATTRAKRTKRDDDASHNTARRHGASTLNVVEPGSGPTGRFRDDSFFLSHSPAENLSAERFMAIGGAGDELREAVLDLTAEDAQGAAMQRSSAWHWDVKSKRYVKLQKGETVKAGKRIAAKGKGKGKEGPSGLYEKWSKKTKLSVGNRHAGSGGRATTGMISTSGGSEKRGAVLADAMQGRFKRGGRGWVNPLKARKGDDVDERRPVRDELKSADQVRKQRKEEEKKKEQQMTRRKHQGGGNGGGGRGGRGGDKKMKGGGGGGGRGGKFGGGMKSRGNGMSKGKGGKGGRK